MLKIRKNLFAVLLGIAVMLTAGAAMAAPSITIQSPTAGVVSAGSIPISGIANVEDIPPNQFIDIMLVIDTSGSMRTADGPNGASRLAAAVTASTNLLGNLNSSYIRVGVVEYTTYETTGSLHGKLVQGLTDNYTAVTTALNSLGTGGGTPMSDGIQLATNEFNANGTAGADYYSLVLTDGNANSQNIAPQTAIDNAIAGDITINTYGIGASVNTSELQDYADQTGGVFRQVDTSNINNIFAPGGGGGTDVTLNQVELTDGTNIWDAVITSQIGNLYTWETAGTVVAPSTTFTATAYDSLGASATDSVTVTTSEPVPEPSTILLLGVGLTGIGVLSRRKNKK